jgi:hypothetical protein
VSVDLSRRLARVVLIEPICGLGYEDRRDIAYAAERATAFTDLPDRFQRLILAAERERQRRISAKRARVGA